MRAFLKKHSGLLATIAISAFIAAGAFVARPLIQEARAAQNYPPSTAVYTMPIQLSGTYSSTSTPVKFNIPYGARLVAFSAAARSIAAGSQSIDIQAAGVSLLSAPMTVSTGVTEATISTAAVADEAAITLVLTVTSGSVSDVTVLPTFVR